jgi:Domain of unknown function (DUF4145)
MVCPHCTISFHDEWDSVGLKADKYNFWSVDYTKCPSCEKLIVKILQHRQVGVFERIIQPKASSRPPVPVEVNDLSVVSDYEEACLVLDDSPKASAALSRRALQHILREKIGVKHQDLNKEIQEVIDSNLLPSDLSENLDAIRNIGNFAAHPIKSKVTGEIVDVESGEAQWNLEVLEELMEYAYVRPARSKAKKDALNLKLAEAGKPTIP